MKGPINRVNLRPLTDEEGTGWLATFPDLPGCMSDGETPEEALQNAADAEALWLEANQEWEAKEPGPVKLVARLPRSLHQDLQTRAKAEGVSLNSMILFLLASGLGKQQALR